MIYQIVLILAEVNKLFIDVAMMGSVDCCRGYIKAGKGSPHGSFIVLFLLSSQTLDVEVDNRDL